MLLSPKIKSKNIYFISIAAKIRRQANRREFRGASCVVARHMLEYYIRLKEYLFIYRNIYNLCIYNGFIIMDS